MRIASKTSTGPVEERSGDAGRNGASFRSGRSSLHEGHQVRGAEGPGDLVDVVRVELELRAEELADALRAAVVDLEPDRRAEAAAAHVLGRSMRSRSPASSSRISMSASRVTRKDEAPQDLHARGRAAVEVRLDELLEEEELRAPCRGVPGHRDEAAAATAGTLTRAKAARLSPSSRRARRRARATGSRRTGTGAPDRRRAASGPGRRRSRSSAVSSLRRSGSISSQDRIRMPASARRGRRSSREAARRERPRRARTISRIARSCSGAESPSALRSVDRRPRAARGGPRRGS